jgi:hypothetical protein
VYHLLLIKTDRLIFISFDLNADMVSDVIYPKEFLVMISFIVGLVIGHGLQIGCNRFTSYLHDFSILRSSSQAEAECQVVPTRC